VTTTRSLAEKIRDFLRDRAGRAFCDECVQARLGVKWRQRVTLITSTLAVTESFVRVAGKCSVCTHAKQVTQATRRATS